MGTVSGQHALIGTNQSSPAGGREPQVFDWLAPPDWGGVLIGGGASGGEGPQTVREGSQSIGWIAPPSIRGGAGRGEGLQLARGISSSTSV